MIYLKWRKGRNYNQEYSTQKDSPSDFMEKSKISSQAKVKRIQHHQTSFTTNAKWISLGRKHKRRKRPIENNPKTIKKTVIESFISIIISKVMDYRKCKWIKDTNQKTLTGWLDENICMYALSLTASLCLTHSPPNCM